MTSKILLKLIDETIVPAILIIASKIIGLALVVWAKNLPWDFRGFVIPAFSFYSSTDYLVANSWSNLFMFATITAFLILTLTRAHIFHDTHISPFLTLKLLTLNLTGFLTTSFDIFHRAIVWLSYSWLTTLLILIQAYLGLCYFWIALLCLGFCVLFTWFFILDIEREVKLW